MVEVRSHNAQGIGSFQTSPIFHWNYESKARHKVNQGGSSSGKTYAILQVIFTRLMQKKRIATVIGQDMPNLRKGAIRDFNERILTSIPWFNNFIRSYNKTTQQFKLYNGSILEFTSFKDFQDAKNGKRDIAFFNEANGIAWPIVEQVAIRTEEEIFYDYNPSSPFWAHERLIGKPGVDTFYSNFTHNPYVSDTIKESLLALRTEDLEAWKVYGLGKTGSLADLVFPNIEMIENHELPTAYHRHGYGMDFGYRADPTALIFCGWSNEKDLFLDEQFYTYGMSSKDIAIATRLTGINRNSIIYADSAEARLIDDLKTYPHLRILGAEKGPDSIRYGIDLINQYNIFITRRSVNLLSEQKKYRYKTETTGDRAGMMTNKPIDAFNHGFDAVRYWSQHNIKPLRPVRSTFRAAIV
jgi:phage terminase large subunit